MVQNANTIKQSKVGGTSNDYDTIKSGENHMTIIQSRVGQNLTNIIQLNVGQNPTTIIHLKARETPRNIIQSSVVKIMRL